jgi:hypothetical protein
MAGNLSGTAMAIFTRAFNMTLEEIEALVWRL